MDQVSQSSLYYQHSGSLPLASRLSLVARQKMFALFMKFFRPNEQTRILDVGVTGDTAHPESNYFERLYPYPQQITCVGTEDGSQLTRQYPGLKFQRVQAGEPLPFADGEFDVVFSNAVLEHTGSRAKQAAFLKEICRVVRGGAGSLSQLQIAGSPSSTTPACRSFTISRPQPSAPPSDARAIAIGPMRKT